MSSEQIEDVMSAMSEMGVNVVENDEEAEAEAEKDGSSAEIAGDEGAAKKTACGP